MSETGSDDDVTAAGGDVLRFPEGIPGFPHAQRFRLIEEVEDGAFQLLECIDDPEVAFIVTVPWLFFPDYAPDLPDDTVEDLGLAEPSDAVVFCPVTLDAQAGDAFVNLLGPFVVNARRREGRQVVLADSDHATRARIDLDGTA